MTITSLVPRSIRRLPLLRRLYFNLFTMRYVRALLFPRPSYAQAGEDTRIRELLNDVRFFIDIGSYDGITDSNTFLFALRGAHGICFEPVRETFIKLSALYRFNRRVECRCCGISDIKRQGTIYPMQGLSCIPETEDPDHSVCHPVLAQRTRCEPIQLVTFADAVAGLDLPDPIDLLSLDVEGHELNVLRSIPFEQFRFRMIVVETHLRQPLTSGFLWRHRDLDAINALLRTCGYYPVSESWANTLYAPRSEPADVAREETGAANHAQEHPFAEPRMTVLDPHNDCCV